MIFRRATLVLTAAFTAVQLLLFAAFAIGIYLFVSGTFDFDAVEADGNGAINAAERGFATLRTALLVSYCVLVVLVPLVSYLMARMALRPLRRSYELQQQFVDGASHELRSPLSVIQGELELVVSQRRTPDDYQAAITISLEAIEELTRLTNDLLLLTQSDRPTRAIVTEEIPVDDIIRAAVDAQGPDAGRVRLDLQPLPPVSASPSLLARALSNVIDNAMKFSPAGSPVTLRTRSEGGHTLIEVIDTGMGMRADEIRHAFERFWRSDSARTAHGHGLGLSLVRQIMLAHRGTASITSIPGTGTTITLTLPPPRR